MPRPALAALSLLLCAMIGCGSDESQESAPVETPVAVALPSVEAPSAASLLPAVGDEEENASLPTALNDALEEPAPATPKKIAVEDYKSPFPDRVDFFGLPKFAGGRASGGKQENSNQVILLGFATLDKPKVVLDINGSITPLEDGEEKLGVRVISISPPQAVLQRGRTRWTASIE